MILQLVFSAVKSTYLVVVSFITDRHDADMEENVPGGMEYSIQEGGNGNNICRIVYLSR